MVTLSSIILCLDQIVNSLAPYLRHLLSCGHSFSTQEIPETCGQLTPVPVPIQVSPLWTLNGAKVLLVVIAAHFHQ